MFAFRRRKPAPEPPTHPGVSGTILVVDDEPGLRIELTHGLTRAGLDVVQCSRGTDVLDAVAAHAPDLVILDVCLPGRGGDEVAKEIAARHPATKILLMTGDYERCAEVNAARLPVFAVLEKPVPMRALLRFVTSTLAVAHDRPALGVRQPSEAV